LKEEEPENPGYPKNTDFKKRFGRAASQGHWRRQDRRHRTAEYQLTYTATTGLAPNCFSNLA
jgi:hypothetical protein